MACLRDLLYQDARQQGLNGEPESQQPLSDSDGLSMTKPLWVVIGTMGWLTGQPHKGAFSFLAMFLEALRSESKENPHCLHLNHAPFLLDLST